MKRSTKGAIAVGAAAVLMLGTAGTVAYWTDEATVDGGAIASGALELTAVTCATDWSYAEGDTTAAVDLIVPGDIVTKQCTGTLTLQGQHIGATVEASEASLPPGPLADELTVAATMTSPAPEITAPGTYDVAIDLRVEFPYGTVSVPDPTTGADNDSQLQTATLDTIELVAVQTHPAG